jgi:hypothetical protein
MPNKKDPQIEGLIGEMEIYKWQFRIDKFPYYF